MELLKRNNIIDKKYSITKTYANKAILYAIVTVWLRFFYGYNINQIIDKYNINYNKVEINFIKKILNDLICSIENKKSAEYINSIKSIAFSYSAYSSKYSASAYAEESIGYGTDFPAKSIAKIAKYASDTAAYSLSTTFYTEKNSAAKEAFIAAFNATNNDISNADQINAVNYAEHIAINSNVENKTLIYLIYTYLLLSKE
jgi:hypothetical protein